MSRYDGNLILPKPNENFKEFDFLFFYESTEKPIFFSVRKIFVKAKSNDAINKSLALKLIDSVRLIIFQTLLWIISLVIFTIRNVNMARNARIVKDMKSIKMIALNDAKRVKLIRLLKNTAKHMKSLNVVFNIQKKEQTLLSEKIAKKDRNIAKISSIKTI